MSIDQIGHADALAAAAFELDGMCILDATLPRSWVASCRQAALDHLDACRRRALAAGHDLSVGMDAGWAEIVQRAPGRYDLLYGTEQAPFTDVVAGADAPWMPLVHQLLGPEARMLYRGLLVAEAGCGEQAWHADGEHLFLDSGLHLPVHCLNVFVPLVDVELSNGPTEFCPGSHRLTGGLPRVYEQNPDLLGRIGYRGDPIVPQLPAGSVLAFDYRLVHRALPNRTGSARPVLYLTFAAPWFCDVRNFPVRRLFAQDLGDIHAGDARASLSGS